jgi:hypothetical protein
VTGHVATLPKKKPTEVYEIVLTAGVARKTLHLGVREGQRVSEVRLQRFLDSGWRVWSITVIPRAGRVGAIRR